MTTRDPSAHHHRDDVAAYLLGALGELEVQAFERHLMSCAECHDEVERLRPAIEALPRSVPQRVAPPSLKQDLMEALERESREAEAEPRLQRRPWRERLPSVVRTRPTLAWAGAAVLLAVGFAVGDAVKPVDGEDGARTVAAKVDSTRVPAASGRLIVPRGGSEGAVLRLHGMPVLGSDKTYQVWLARGKERTSQSMFSVAANGEGSGAVSDRVKGADAVLVTREPAGGGSRPSEQPIVRVPLRGR